MEKRDFFSQERSIVLFLNTATAASSTFHTDYQNIFRLEYTSGDGWFKLLLHTVRVHYFPILAYIFGDH